MKKEEIFSFVKKFNNIDSIPLTTVVEGLNKLSPKEHKLFMLLVNYKNGDDFLKKVKNGEV